MTGQLLVAAVAFGIVVLTTPVTSVVARHLGVVDQPGGRRVHQHPTPRLGGMALLAGFLGAVAAGAVLPDFREVFVTTSDPEAVVLAAVVIAVIGLADDVVGLSAPAKFAGQVLAAGTAVLFGIALRYVLLPGEVGLVVLSPDVAALFTIAAIVAMVNAVNLVDGLDGLAAGVVAIASAGLLLYVQLVPPEIATGLTASAELLLATLIGMCLGFLVHNSHPATVFMGDSGAMLLGLLLAAASVLAVGGTIEPSGRDFAALSIPILIPAAVLAVPFLDTISTIVRRLASGRAVFSPDKLHLHHRLIELGHSQRRAVLILYYWSALFAAAAVGIGVLPRRDVLALVGVGALVGIAIGLGGGRGRHRRTRRRGQSLVQDFTKYRHRQADQVSDLRKHPNSGL